MVPTFYNNQRVVVWKIGELNIGNVIICYDPRDRRLILKRIAKIKIADKRYSILDRTKKSRISNTKYPIYFVLGDNSKESTDSRRFGWIEKKDIVGKVIWPRV